jgi:uncharacterized membrane protein
MAEEVDTKWMELIDKLDGFKRYTLVVPIELCFIIVVLIMVYRGMYQEALVAVSGTFGIMVGYYFGVSQAKNTG